MLLRGYITPAHLYRSFAMVIHFFRVVISFCVVIQLSRGYMVLFHGYLVHLHVCMVFRGYMTFPWLYGSLRG